MGSLIEELRRREAAARAEADRLRTRIEELSEELARAEEQATRLAIAREEVTRVLGEPAAVPTPHRRSPLLGRRQMGPGRRRGCSHPDGSDRQRRLRGVLALPP
jgi:septal ring factor EnvC (AmiA/AmiB activator)